MKGPVSTATGAYDVTYVDRGALVLLEERAKEAERRARRPPKRKASKPALAIAKNCPDIFAEDAEFMRLFRESKRLEGLKGQKAKLTEVMRKLKARGWFLEKQAAAYG
jgi:hypothetical protein